MDCSPDNPTGFPVNMRDASCQRQVDSSSVRNPLPIRNHYGHTVFRQNLIRRSINNFGMCL